MGGSSLQSRFRHRGIEAANYFFDCVKSSSHGKIRLIIFGQGRSGSTVLENLICSTGYFCENGELLNTDRGEILYPIQYIRGLSKRRASENIIFHVKVYQLTRDRKHPIDPAEFLNALCDDGWKIIYLQRKNKVRHAISTIVALNLRRWEKYNDEEEHFSLKIDCNDFIDKVKERFRFEEAERNALANIQHHEVIYEDDLEKSDTHQVTVNRILDYISLEHREAFTRLRKVNTQSLKDLIVNYDEFVTCLASQKWLEFL